MSTDHTVENIQELLDRRTSLFYYHTVLLCITVIQHVTEPKLSFFIVLHQCCQDTASRVPMSIFCP